MGLELHWNDRITVSHGSSHRLKSRGVGWGNAKLRMTQDSANQ